MNWIGKDCPNATFSDDGAVVIDRSVLELAATTAPVDEETLSLFALTQVTENV